ncbi:haloalkane dehalogenase family protein [Paecilomyces variotii No. 5]|uniref:Haloalkane dehalogenase family protein n=1 Tax=Byssochlamys spectabilis (strain No. 5 / NBRC 109023) TaxID=1356009 RepID=V5FL96_BYSSN|nr:haloalkane dehalogenase family protein [Paecilomyces variotii No. 5]
MRRVPNRALSCLAYELSKLYGILSTYSLSWTTARLCVVIFLLPLYILSVALRVLPYVAFNAIHLFSEDGRRHLVSKTDGYRAAERERAQKQLRGSFVFRGIELQRLGRDEMTELPWGDRTQTLRVCGADARFIKVRPRVTLPGETSRPPIVLLHGNPSWSFMWRNIIPHLLDQGHEVYALDWLGHGRSDKILRKELISFELHMRTLIEFFNRTQLRDAVVVAHDWGGCVALCTIPHLQSKSISRLFLLNSFLPPRPSDISVHCYLLYVIWYLVTGIFDGYIPEPLIMRFMVPRSTNLDLEGYRAPYKLDARTKQSVTRFAHMVPGLPRQILRDIRHRYLWRMLEGLCGPVNFSDINAQALLSVRDDSVRDFWANVEQSDWKNLKVMVAFGQDDTLLRDYKRVLVRSIGKHQMVNWAKNGVWIAGAGHYPVEERPYEVVRLIAMFARE